jgi:hypothetical protein
MGAAADAGKVEFAAIALEPVALAAEVGAEASLVLSQRRRRAIEKTAD